MAEAEIYTWVGKGKIDPAACESGFRSSLDDSAGAVVSFSGVVRGTDDEGGSITQLELEHYPGMTEKMLRSIAVKSCENRSLLAVAVRHRHGPMSSGEVIVNVLVAARHRADAFAACSEIVDRLKSDVPFWKKESGAQGERWLEPTK